MRGSRGSSSLLAVDLEGFRAALARAATRLQVEAPSDLMIETWWEQARTLEDE